MDQKYAFLSYLIPDSMQEEVLENTKNNMQAAANALQWHLYNGLCQNLKDQIQIFNFLPISNYPQYYKKAFVKTALFETAHSKDNVNLGFCNIKLIRRSFQYRTLIQQLEKWLSQNDAEKTVFIYTASDIFLKAVYNLKKKYLFQTCVIIADLPSMANLSTNGSKIREWFVRHIAKETQRYLQCIDCFVLLTVHMAEYLKIEKPFCVMEGISTEFPEPDLKMESSECKVVFYSGLLHKRFGILNLLEAFHGIQDENYRLMLCGMGDAEKEIDALCKCDTRIQYLGQLSRDQVLALQQQATVLINPRQNDEEFTKYSFPSKNLEYLSSGRPLIAYKLDGIPDEYDEYIFYVPDNSVQALREKIQAVCRMPETELLRHGDKAKRYVMTHKNEIAQTQKIVSLLQQERSKKSE